MIGFLHPWLLAGLAAAGLPIVLHLLERREPPTVIFPAVRYLIAATERHQRRLRLQNWLLLLLRTLLIVLLVLAAAGPTVRAGHVAGHAPSAMVLIVDNSASSGAVVEGTPRLATLRAAAARVLAQATPDDALWLIAADGTPRRGDPRTLSTLIDQLTPSPRRVDLGAALATAGEVLAPETRPGEVVVVTDLQATAVSPAELEVPVLVIRPAGPPPRNVGIASLALGSQPWPQEGGRAIVTLTGDSGPAVPVSVRVGERTGRQALGSINAAVTVTLPGAPPGWWPVTAEIDPDELRADDRRVGLVRIAPPARVRWDPAERYVAAAADVLERNRRIARGDAVSIGRLEAGTSIVEPPADVAELGALNRALERRGVGWSYGSLVTGSETADSALGLGGIRVFKRYVLESSASGRTGLLARVNRSPWLVRSGSVVLLGSRLDPAWTELPVSAAFMPFMDLLLNRIARGELAVAEAAPGDAVSLPDRVTEVRRGGERWPAEGGAAFRPDAPGLYLLLAERDTVGALEVNVDPRESRLTPAPDDQVRRLWRARVVSPDAAGDAVFASAARGDLRGPLLWAGLLLGLSEMGLASAWRRES
jgi:Aerotolerance regulator N-terminal/von Willebrand factor type A domain